MPSDAGPSSSPATAWRRRLLSLPFTGSRSRSAGEVCAAQLDSASSGEGNSELEEDRARGNLCRYLMAGPVSAAGNGGALVVMDGSGGFFGSNAHVEPGPAGDAFGTEFAAEGYRAAAVMVGEDLLAQVGGSVGLRHG